MDKYVTKVFDVMFVYAHVFRFLFILYTTCKGLTNRLDNTILVGFCDCFSPINVGYVQLSRRSKTTQK